MLSILSGFGCASHQVWKKSLTLRECLHALRCSTQPKIQPLKGTLAFKLQSKEFSGQFLGDIEVNAKGNLKLQMRHFLGGKVGLVSMNQSQYQIEFLNDDKKEKIQGKYDWNGIPIKWIYWLFLGSPPCLSKTETGFFDSGSPHQLIVDSLSGRMIYDFFEDSTLRVKSARWFENNSKDSIVFYFKNFDKKTGDIIHWEVQAQELTLKVFWKQRFI